MANQVGAKIKEARTAAGLTQAALAEKVGVSAKDISKAERGEKELTKDQLKAIAKATGVTQKSLLEAAKAEPEKPAITEEELLELYKSADDDTKNAAIAVLKGEAPQNAGFDMSSMMSMFGGMMGGGNAEGGEGGDGAAGFDMSSMMGMMGGGEGGDGAAGFDMSSMMGMMGGGNAESGEAEEKKEG